MWERAHEPAGPLRKPTAPGQARAQAPPALELQRTIGNRATTEVLARGPATKASKPPAKAEPEVSRAVLPGVGEIPIESFSMGKSSITGEHKTALKSIAVSSLSGAHSPGLMKAVMVGKAFETATIVWIGSGGKKITVELKGAIITSYQVSPGEKGGPPIEYWSIDFDEAKWSVGDSAATSSAPPATLALPGRYPG